MVRPLSALIAAALGLLCLVSAAVAAPVLSFAKGALGAADVALIINELDPYSREVGAHYAAARGIPAHHVIRVRFEPQPNLPRETFERLRAEVEARLPAGIQAYALAWTRPWRVDCMSITSAFAFGFDPALCSARQCAPTRPNPLFDGWSVAPFADHGIRPAMLIAGESAAAARRMIDRGVAVEGGHPAGSAYLVTTPDGARNTRAPQFAATAQGLGARLPVRLVSGSGVGERDDVLFYFTGAPHVEEVEQGGRRLALRPGALADHLTSLGGVLEGSSQMSALAWLAAGASASYGTVVEPCSHPQKFPVPAIAISSYLAGATALEAYWRSVAWPGEGVFVGDPLARPFAPVAKADGEDALRLTLHAPGAARLLLYASASPVGPFRALGRPVPLKPGRNQLQLRQLDQGFYRAALIPE